MIGICTFCGEFGKVETHHYTKRKTIVFCVACHRFVHSYASVSALLGDQTDRYIERTHRYPFSVSQKKPKYLRWIKFNDEIKPIKPEGGGGEG